jgi:Putative peptidoglycan binding domain
MRRSLMVCVGSLTLVVTVGAQIPYNHRKAPQRTTTYSGYRGTGAVPQVPPRRTFSPPRYRQPAFSNARFHQPMPGTTRVQPRVNSSLTYRPTMTNTTAWRRTRPTINDWSSSSTRPRADSAFGNRSAIDDIAAQRQTRLGGANDWRESRLSARPQPTRPVLNRFTMDNAAARRPMRREFRNRWADSNFRGQDRTSFVNRSRSTSFWSENRAAVPNNWRGDAFAGRRYWAFRNYQRQWHDSGWWHDHCGDRIVFITVYSQPFPFYFDSGYWYPAWGYYPDSYYPYDGPIYGYNDLPPDEVITNVQTQLYYEGYYDGPIDGILGPDTRAAIADYQADHGLAVTAAVDEPTFESLGLT